MFTASAPNVVVDVVSSTPIRPANETNSIELEPKPSTRAQRCKEIQARMLRDRNLLILLTESDSVPKFRFSSSKLPQLQDQNDVSPLSSTFSFLYLIKQKSSCSNQTASPPATG